MHTYDLRKNCAHTFMSNSFILVKSWRASISESIYRLQFVKYNGGFPTTERKITSAHNVDH